MSTFTHPLHIFIYLETPAKYGKKIMSKIEDIKLQKAKILVRSNACLKTVLYNGLIFYQNILFKGKTYSDSKMFFGGKTNGI